MPLKPFTAGVWSALAWVLLTAAVCLLFGCAGDDPRQVSEPKPEPPRGVVLVSIDTLRADHLGAYGYHRDTSPYLDALAAESVVFEAAIAQAPSTLTSHLAMFTSLFPSQFFPTARGPVPAEGHGLSTEIPTFPEILHDAGFRTAGHTEGGYVSSVYGFERGFEEWTDPTSSRSTDIEQTVEKGLDFLTRMAARPDERFLLFLHTYSVHDPYEPPESYRGLFTREAPTDERASAQTLLAVNAGRRATSEEEAEYFAARYDEGIRYADSVLARLWNGLEELALGDEVAVVVTSDHGEEFLEHGRYLHTQLYPEQLHVPLFVRVPGVEPRRVAMPVRTIDLAPTLLDLLALEPLRRASGQSLVPFLTSDQEAADEIAQPEPICSETWYAGSLTNLLLARADDGWLWTLRERPSIDPGGAWVSDALEFDHPFSPGAAGLRLLAYHEPRTIRVKTSGGETLLERVVPPEWIDVELPRSAAGRRLRLEVDGCVSPSRTEGSDDIRCLGVQMAQPVLQRRTYLAGFPASPLVPKRPSPDAGPDLEDALGRCAPPLLAESTALDPGETDREGLCALGYLSEEQCAADRRP